MKDYKQEYNRLRGWMGWCIIPLVVFLHGCTAHEESAAPGSPLYTTVIDQSVNEQNNRDSRGMEDGRGGT